MVYRVLWVLCHGWEAPFITKKLNGRMELGCFGLKFRVFGKFNWKRHLLWRYEAEEKHEFFGGLVHPNLKVERFNLTLFFAVTWFGSLASSAV
ncbi:hypothetical protein [Vibrio hibernica]|uniref:hypothetical protein n=1 Tax=Vibrio hibernica TaxID=2587465 RepID=UPI001881E49B|nr:hypothetical protein [Vibrio hibernica]